MTPEDMAVKLEAVDQRTYAEKLANLGNENGKLKSQLQMQAQQQEFLENCLLEMGDVVYA